MASGRRQTYILNPVAGRRGRRHQAALLETLATAGDNVEVLRTGQRGEAETLARARRDDGDRVVIAVGGDGTVHEVASGLVGGAAAMGVLPVGSGNDFASMVAVPESPQRAPEFFARQSIRACDVGSVEWMDAHGHGGQRWFINSLGLAFEGAAAERAERLARVPGFLRYLLAVALELPAYRAPLMQLELDGVRLEARQFLLAVGNGRRAGGGFVLNPDACIDDGWLDVCRADDLPLHRLLRILPSVFRGGHVAYAGVHTARCKRLEIECQPATAVHADGEILTLGAVRLSVRVVPGGLRLAG